MNEEQLKHCILVLTEEELISLSAGASLCLIDDQRLSVVKEAKLNRIDISLPDDHDNPESIRQQLIDQAADVLDRYYRVHPLSEAGFNHQVRQLVEQLGAEQFAATSGSRPPCTLFVDRGEVVAEPQGNPRHPYGSYCELYPAIATDAIADQVLNWIDSGEAYSQYLAMMVPI